MTTYRLTALDEQQQFVGESSVQSTVLLNPYDILVVRVADNFSHNEYEQLRSRLFEVLPHRKILLVSSAVEFLKISEVQA